MAVADCGNALNYDRAISALGGKQEVKIGHNTWVCRKDNGDVAVKYHYTDIITFHPDYTITVRTGGWDTNTTRGRLDHLLENHRVYGNGGGVIEDVEGTAYWLDSVIEINSLGLIEGRVPIFVEKLSKFLKVEMKTIGEAKQAVAGLSLELMEKAWNKFRGDRGFLARNCIETFLPLALASSNDGDEHWMTILRQRLGKDAA